MKLLMRLFVAFCVATVLAQCIILALSAARGNITTTTPTQLIALLNGIDIGGDRLQKMLDDSKQTPVPTYQEVIDRRAQDNLNLDMRERSIQLSQEQLRALQATLQLESKNFDNRKDAFYAKLNQFSKGLEEDSLKEVKRTLESLAPEQSKDLLLKMIEDNKLNDVVAIVKGMAQEKQKKIFGEFLQPEELEKLYEILSVMRQGEPTASLIDQARNDKAATKQ